jgi:hypothetical protein
MEASEPAKTPAGWYDNPHASGLRYFDGKEWKDSYHPGNLNADSPTFKEVVWALALGFALTGGAIAAVGVPVLGFYFPLGFGVAGLGLSLVAGLTKGEASPWWAVLAVLASLAALGIGIDGYNEFSDASSGLRDLGR